MWAALEAAVVLGTAGMAETGIAEIVAETRVVQTVLGTGAAHSVPDIVTACLDGLDPTAFSCNMVKC